VPPESAKLAGTFPVILGCIDIGSNTTRLLVADATEDGLTEIASRRAFTRIGRSMGDHGHIPHEKVAETAAVAALQARLALDSGCVRLAALATAAIRDASNGDELCSAVEARIGQPLEVLSGEEEARLSFAGATRTQDEAGPGPVAVVDVGGGSTEIAIGDGVDGVSWWRSLPIGSGLLADAHLDAGPPTLDQIDAMRADVSDALDGLDFPPVAIAMAVGGTATSLRRLAGDELDHRSLERAVRALAGTDIERVAAPLELAPERVRLLPAGIVVLQEVSRRLGRPLHIALGGLREGKILEMHEQASAL
jgi:exopolyphosphatase/guanosine-5'-triphosphate,3'-diphosphate pyrophosphatase